MGLCLRAASPPTLTVSGCLWPQGSLHPCCFTFLRRKPGCCHQRSVSKLVPSTVRPDVAWTQGLHHRPCFSLSILGAHTWRLCPHDTCPLSNSLARATHGAAYSWSSPRPEAGGLPLTGNGKEGWEAPLSRWHGSQQLISKVENPQPVPLASEAGRCKRHQCRPSYSAGLRPRPHGRQRGQCQRDRCWG